MPQQQAHQDPNANSPLVTREAVPESISDFARQMIENRVLAAPLEVDIPLQSTAARVRDMACFAPLAGIKGFDEWIDWLLHWAARFKQHSNAAAVRMRISHSRQPSCPRFHVDGVRMRLIAPLVGPGTQWLQASDVSYLDDGSISQTPDPDVVQQLAPRSVGIFHGVGYDHRGVVHRSPPDHIDRVVMTLDIAA